MLITQKEIEELKNYKDKFLQNRHGYIYAIRSWKLESIYVKKWFRKSRIELHITEITVSDARCQRHNSYGIVTSEHKIYNIVWNLHADRSRFLELKEQLDDLGYEVKKKLF